MTKRPRRGASKVDAVRLQELLQSDNEDDWRTAQRLIKQASTPRLVDALNESRDATVRATLCHALGRRCDSEAVPALTKCLRDRSGRVCTEAAEALGNIGDGRAGAALLERFGKPGRCSRNLLIYALGAVGYQPAIPMLTLALGDSDLRGSAALALGSLGAVQARSAMERALRAETDDVSSRRLIERGLVAISLMEVALQSENLEAALPSVLEALEGRDVVLNKVAVRAIALIGDNRAEALLRKRLSRARRNYALVKRINEALEVIVP